MALINFDFYNNFQKDLEEENVIIGSGAGGSTTAIELLKINKKSIILEEGPNVENLKQKNIGNSVVSFYKNNGATPMFSFNGGPLIGYGQGSCVGGSTFVNAGYFSNTPEWVYNNWIKLQQTNLSFNNFQKLINEIKSEIKVSTENITNIDGDSKYLLERSKQLNWKVDKCDRFSDGKLPSSKQSMNVTYHKKILKNNIDIFYNCRVLNIITNNQTAYKLIVENKKSKKKYKIKFKNLFINCGPISSPYLLLKNKLISFKKNQNNFQFHINFKIIVKFKKKINFNYKRFYDPSYPVSIFFMRHFQNEGILLSAANSEIPYQLATLSHFEDQFKKDLYENFENYGMFIYQIKSDSFGQVKNFLNIPYVSYNFDKKDLLQIKIAIKRLTKFFLEGDAEFILFPVENSLPVRSPTDSEDLSRNLHPKKLHLISVHGMGSLRSGVDEGSMTNYYGQLKNFKNIYINDASILPGNTGESPQASIMAFAKYNIQNL